ncbi:hypothetical protein ACJX0J_005996, partial [Zea mays]
WREFVWGGMAGAFGEGMMHPVDTLKTRLQSQAIMTGAKAQKNIFQMVRTVWASDGLRGFYRGISPGVTGSLATGATYFGIIESTKAWLEIANPNLSGHWSHFIAGAIGDTLGSFVYVPCEVMKQRMQIQGTQKSWASAVAKGNISQTHGIEMYGYYNGMFHAGCSIWRDHGLKGLYAGYWSTLARDVPFAGLMVTFYEAMKKIDLHVSNSFEGLVLGGLAGGMSTLAVVQWMAGCYNKDNNMKVIDNNMIIFGWNERSEHVTASESLAVELVGPTIKTHANCPGILVPFSLPILHTASFQGYWSRKKATKGIQLDAGPQFFQR